MDIIRKEVTANNVTAFEFDEFGTHFVVKNLGEKPIYACLGNTYIESESAIVIPLLSDNLIIDETKENSVKSVQIFAEENGEVEVQLIKYSVITNDMAEILEIINNGVYGKDIKKAIYDGFQLLYNEQQNIKRQLS